MNSSEILGMAMDEVLDEEYAELMEILADCGEHRFSDKHEREMRKLISRQRKPYFKLISSAGRRVACLIVSVLILSVSALSVKAICEEVFFDSHPKEIEKEYYIPSIMTDYEEERSTIYVTAKRYLRRAYQKKNGGERIEFSQFTKEYYDEHIDQKHKHFETVTDENGQKYTVVKSAGGGFITFIWDNGEYVFVVTGNNLDKDELLDLCKSIKVKEEAHITE